MPALNTANTSLSNWLLIIFDLEKSRLKTESHILKKAIKFVHLPVGPLPCGPSLPLFLFLPNQKFHLVLFRCKICILASKFQVLNQVVNIDVVVKLVIM